MPVMGSMWNQPRVAFATICTVTLTVAAIMMGAVTQPDPGVVTITYRLKFDHKGDLGEIQPSFYVVENNIEKQVDLLPVAPGDIVKAKLLKPNNDWPMGKWEATFLGPKGKGRDPPPRDEKVCTLNVTDSVGGKHLAVAVRLTDASGRLLGGVKQLTSSASEQKLDTPSELCRVTGLLNIDEQSRNVSENQFRTNGDITIPSDYSMLSGPQYKSLQAWSESLVIEITIERVP